MRTPSFEKLREWFLEWSGLTDRASNLVGRWLELHWPTIEMIEDHACNA